MPYCNTLHIPGEMHWHSRLSICALWDSTNVNVTGFIDTLLNGGECFTLSDFSACGTRIQTSKPVRAVYSIKIVTPTEYEPTEYAYCLLPSELLGTEYYVASLYTPASSDEYVGFVSTADGNDIYVNGVLRGTYGAGECDTIHFSSDVVHITSTSPIAVVHICARTSNHDAFFGYSLLPTEFWGTVYISAPFPALWGTGYISPTDSSRLIVTALSDGTNVSVAGIPYTLDAGDKLVVPISGLISTPLDIVADSPVQVVRFFWIIATDPWGSHPRRWYETATLIASERANTKCGYISSLPSSHHGGAKMWYTITSIVDSNRVRIDVGFDGTVELDTILDSLATLVLHDTTSLLPGCESQSSRVEAEKPIQLIYNRRGWWTDHIEAHEDYTFFVPSPCEPVDAMYICPPPGVFSSCVPQEAIFALYPPSGTDLDTTRTYFTVIISHPGGTADTMTLFEPTDHLSFVRSDTMWFATAFIEAANGDTVFIRLDSVYTTDGCITVFGE